MRSIGVPPVFIIVIIFLLDTSSALNEVDQLFEDYFRWKVQEFPEHFSVLGVDSAPAKLENYSFPCLMSRLRSTQGFNQRARILAEDTNVRQPETRLLNK